MYTDKFWYSNMTATIPSSWHYATGAISLLILIGGIVFNGLVILVFLKNDALQRPRNYFLINLAVTDLGLLLTNNTMHTISSFRKQWIFGQIGCDFYSVCGGVFGLTSVATMAAISITRLAAVNDPFSSLKLTSRFTLGCLALSWLYGSVWIMPPLFGWNRFIVEGFGTSCTFDYISKDFWDRAFILVLIIGGFFIPLLVIILSYTTIVIKLFQRGRRLTKHAVEGFCSQAQTTPLGTYYFTQLQPKNEHHPRSISTPIHDTGEDRNITRNVRRTEIRATRTALFILFLFCSAWGPYTVMALFSSFGFDHLVNAYSTSLLGIFTKASACINPLVYALSLRGFREQICAYVRCVWQCDLKKNRFLLTQHDPHRTPVANIVEIPTRNRSHWNSMNRLNVP